MMSVVSGLALSLSGGVAVTGVPEAFSSLAYARIFGIPIPVVIALAVLAICIVVLRYTKLGDEFMRLAAMKKRRGFPASP